jgi:hypothetical protein
LLVFFLLLLLLPCLFQCLFKTQSKTLLSAIMRRLQPGVRPLPPPRVARVAFACVMICEGLVSLLLLLCCYYCCGCLLCNANPKRRCEYARAKQSCVVWRSAARRRRTASRQRCRCSSPRIWPAVIISALSRHWYGLWWLLLLLLLLLCCFSLSLSLSLADGVVYVF